MTIKIRWLLAAVVSAGIAVCPILALGARATVPPEHYEQAVAITLVRRNLAPIAILVTVCPAGPTGCYRGVYAEVVVTVDRPHRGFMTCQRMNAACELTIEGLGLVGVLLPDIASTGSAADHIWARLEYARVQTRALIMARLW